MYIVCVYIECSDMYIYIYNMYIVCVYLECSEQSLSSSLTKSWAPLPQTPGPSRVCTESMYMCVCACVCVYLEYIHVCECLCVCVCVCV